MSPSDPPRLTREDLYGLSPRTCLQRLQRQIDSLVEQNADLRERLAQSEAVVDILWNITDEVASATGVKPPAPVEHPLVEP